MVATPSLAWTASPNVRGAVPETDSRVCVIKKVLTRSSAAWLGTLISTADPLGPVTAMISPRAADKLAPRSAGVWPNDLCTSIAWMRGFEIVTRQC